MSDQLAMQEAVIDSIICHLEARAGEHLSEVSPSEKPMSQVIPEDMDITGSIPEHENVQMFDLPGKLLPGRSNKKRYVSPNNPLLNQK